MKLEELLARDREANDFFTGLPNEVQQKLRHCGEGVKDLAALREYARDVTAETIRPDGSPLDPALRAEWTRSHQT